MTKKHSTKKALITSVLALCLCCAMLVGTTFAWFTDSVTSANNKIVAGNLDVQLFMHTSATSSVEITDTSAPIFGGEDSLMAQNDASNTLWEPGKTQVVYLSIKNNGSLDMKYKVALDVRNPLDGKDLYKVMSYDIIEDARYNEVTSWAGGVAVTVGTNATQANNVTLGASEEHFFALAVHMDENAGNEYMNGMVEFDIKVLAAQLSSEEDSFGNDYDALAPYGNNAFVIGATTVTTTATAGEIATVANADETAKATATVGSEGKLTITVEPTSSTEAVFETVVEEGKSLISYDVKVTGQEEGTPVTVELYVGKNLVDVVVYHNGNAMRTADYSYNPTTGVVTIVTTTFSPFEIAFKYAEGLPTAKVTMLEDIPEELEVAYRFSSTEVVPDPDENGNYTDEQIEEFLNKVAPYGLWHADFVVTFNKALDAEQVVLGGQYDSWSDTWLFFENPKAIEAGEELRLLGGVAKDLINKDIYINYAELCGYVKDFNCGIGAAEGADISGTTVTVELRLYETYSEEECFEKFGYLSINEETGKYVSIATYVYTFK